MTNINVSAAVIAKVSHFATDKYQPELSGLYIAADIVLALNRFQCCMYKKQDDEVDFTDGEPFILKVTPDLIKACTHKLADRVVVKNDRLTIIAHNFKELYIQPNEYKIEGTYPDISVFMNRDSEEHYSDLRSISLNYESFEVLRKSFGKKVSVNMRFTANGGPIFNDVYDNGELLKGYTVVIMPSNIV